MAIQSCSTIQCNAKRLFIHDYSSTPRHPQLTNINNIITKPKSAPHIDCCQKLFPRILRPLLRRSHFYQFQIALYRGRQQAGWMMFAECWECKADSAVMPDIMLRKKDWNSTRHLLIYLVALSEVLHMFSSKWSGQQVILSMSFVKIHRCSSTKLYCPTLRTISRICTNESHWVWVTIMRYQSNMKIRSDQSGTVIRSDQCP